MNEGRSRDVYHTKRMQRVFSVKFSSDANYVISGSDDTNIRIWKAQSNKALGIVCIIILFYLFYITHLKY